MSTVYKNEYLSVFKNEYCLGFIKYVKLLKEFYRWLSIFYLSNVCPHCSVDTTHDSRKLVWVLLANDQELWFPLSLFAFYFLHFFLVYKCYVHLRWSTIKKDYGIFFKSSSSWSILKTRKKYITRVTGII